MSHLVVFLVITFTSIGVIEKVAVPVAKATVGYTTEAVDWAKDKVSGE